MKDYKRFIDREIAEMAKAMSDFEMEDAAKCDIELAEHLLAKGYRKQSDTVREFVRRVHEVYDERWRFGSYDIFDLWSDIIYLAAAEYGAEVKE